MNIQHRDQILELLSTNHTNYDIFKALSANYSPAEIETLTINGLSIKSIVTRYKRVITQLESELNSDNYFYLPIDNNDPRLGEFNLINNLHNIIQHIESNDLVAFENSLQKQIMYQVIWGFWNRSQSKIHDVETLQLNEAIEGIDMGKKALLFQTKKLEELYLSISTKMMDMQNFIDQKQKDVELINSKRDEILNHISETQQAVISANELKNQTETAKNSTSDLREEAKRNIDEQKEYVKNFQEQSSQLAEELKEKLDDAKKKLISIKQDHSHVEDMKDYIELKEKEIIKLAAQAGDGALGHMFDKRKSDLAKSAGRWMWATIIMTAVLFGWIFIVFYFLSDTTYEPQWINPLVSVLKTVPAFIMLAFFAKQYTKERNLQEDYAFKASIAMTIMAYADVIDTDSANSDRIEVIRKSIDAVYKIPKITTERIGIGIGTKASREAVNNLNNITQTLTESIQALKK